MAHIWRIDNDEMRIQTGTRGLYQPLLEELGQGCSQFTWFDDELQMIETRYATKRDFTVINRIDNEEPRLVLTVGLRGHSRYIGNDGTTVEFKEGYSSISTFNAVTGERQYRGHEDIHQLRVSIHRNWLSRHFCSEQVAKLFAAGAVRSIGYSPVSAIGETTAKELSILPLRLANEKLYAQGLIMVLIATELGPLLTSDERCWIKANAKNKQIAEAARGILAKEYQNPPTVVQLAARVGTNSFKLKDLFHRYFGNTPYGVLLGIRMNKAYQLLCSTQCHISIAAYSVGYRHAGNFSAAFKRFYGFSPKEVLNRRSSKPAR